MTRTRLRKLALSLAVVVIVGAVALVYLASRPSMFPPADSAWGPLAVSNQPGSGNFALLSGTLQISDACALVNSQGESVLPVWPAARTTWDADERHVVYELPSGAVVELEDGDLVQLGGSGPTFSGPEASDMSWEEWVATGDWAAAPKSGCVADSAWSVGDILVDDQQ